MKLEVRNISISSLVTSSLPLVVFTGGLLGGIITFFVVPNPQLYPMTLGSRLLSIGIFSLLYVVMVSAFIVFLSFMYNMLTGVLGMRGVAFELEEVAEQE
jgi:hypothetical protein